MDSPVALTIIGLSWISIGVLLAVTLGRRGHSGFGWLIVGSLLGPVGVVLAYEAVHDTENLAARTVSAPTVPRTEGAVNVLAGVDGSTEAQAAIDAAVDLLGPRLGRLTLATVTPFDTIPAAERAALETLREAAERISPLDASTEIVHGHPATALAEAALEGGFDVLVVGRKGAGHAHLFGSTAKELAAGTDLPVIIGGSDR